MTSITLITVGKVKESFYRDGITEFTKRLSRYCKLSIIEVADEKTPDQAPAAIESQIKDREGKRILKYIDDTMHVCALAIDGRAYSSVQLSDEISRLENIGESNLCFIIGGSLGLSDEVYQRADWKLSFSKMTFPHQLMRLIFLEQLYRAYKISKNEPYHK